MGRHTLGNRHRKLIENLIEGKLQVDSMSIIDDIKELGYRNGPTIQQTNHYLRLHGFHKVERGTYRRDGVLII